MCPRYNLFLPRWQDLPHFWSFDNFFCPEQKIFLRLGCIVAKADDGLAAVVVVAPRSVNSASYCPTTRLADYNAVTNYYNLKKCIVLYSAFMFGATTVTTRLQCSNQRLWSFYCNEQFLPVYWEDGQIWWTNKHHVSFYGMLKNVFQAHFMLF